MLTELTPDLINALQRMINPTNSAEGSLLPPRYISGTRVPLISRLTTLSSNIITVSASLAQLTCTLSWIDAESSRNLIDHYNIYSFALPAASSYGQPAPATSGIQEMGITTAHKSPATINLPLTVKAPIVFVIQTVLNNGMTSSILNSSSTTIMANW